MSRWPVKSDQATVFVGKPRPAGDDPPGQRHGARVHSSAPVRAEYTASSPGEFALGDRVWTEPMSWVPSGVSKRAAGGRHPRLTGRGLTRTRKLRRARRSLVRYAPAL